MYLLVMAQCNWRTRNWTRQTLGTCPQCAVGCEEENTQIYNTRQCWKPVRASLW